MRRVGGERRGEEGGRGDGGEERGRGGRGRKGRGGEEDVDGEERKRWEEDDMITLFNFKMAWTLLEVMLHGIYLLIYSSFVAISLATMPHEKIFGNEASI